MGVGVTLAMEGWREESTPPDWGFPKVLAKSRVKQTRLLKHFTDICSVLREEGLGFWLIGGSLLGAIRHGGFIPHDDDLDIGCYDEDLSRIRAVLPARLGCVDWGTSYWNKTAFVQFAFGEGTPEEVVIDFFHRPRDDSAQSLDPRYFLCNDEIEPLQEAEFCGLTVPIPRATEAYLDRCYEGYDSHVRVYSHGDTFSIKHYWKLPLDRYLDLV